MVSWYLSQYLEQQYNKAKKEENIIDNADVMDLVGKLVSKNNVEIYISGPGLYLLLLKHSIFVGL